ncbi:hypothetical protein KM043_015517 [Ampulex compressa]|nr:hypothetical protein KM043_015517 [Ampulex compressa]
MPECEARGVTFKRQREPDGTRRVIERGVWVQDWWKERGERETTRQTGRANIGHKYPLLPPSILSLPDKGQSKSPIETADESTPIAGPSHLPAEWIDTVGFRVGTLGGGRKKGNFDSGVAEKRDEKVPRRQIGLEQSRRSRYVGPSPFRALNDAFLELTYRRYESNPAGRPFPIDKWTGALPPGQK